MNTFTVQRFSPIVLVVMAAMVAPIGIATCQPDSGQLDADAIETEKWTFDDAKTGSLPNGWRAEVTNQRGGLNGQGRPERPVEAERTGSSR